MRSILNPPATAIEPVTEIIHGMTICDPYRWLEDQDSAQTRRWLEEQAAYKRAYVDAIPYRDKIRKRVEELLGCDGIYDAWKVGCRYFFLKRSGLKQQMVITMYDSEINREVTLVDPLDTDRTATTAVRILAISKSGDFLAYRVYHGGDAFHTTEVFDVREKRVLSDRLPLGLVSGLVFSSDGKGFYYSLESASSPPPRRKAVYHHEFGKTFDKDQEIFIGGAGPRVGLHLLGSADGRFLGYIVFRSGDAPELSFYVQDTTSDKPACNILTQTSTDFLPCFVGSRVFVLTDWGAPNRRVVAFDVDDPGQSHWVEIVPEGSRYLSNFCIVGQVLCLVRVEESSTRIEVFSHRGDRLGEVPCPAYGTVHIFMHFTDSDSLFYKFSSFDEPPTIFSWRPGESHSRKWAQMQVPFDPSSIEIQRVSYKSKDGMEIPISLVRKKGQLSSRPVPAFLTGYGGYGTSRTPQFNVYSTFLIESGFLFAVANLRGGGEFGEEWHRFGKRHNKQNSFDDFIAAAEWLIREGYTTPGRLAIGGMSNGGLLVGASLTQRPDLFRAVLCVAPLLDMLRYHLFDNADFNKNEFGSPEDEEDFRHLIEYSPYHRVKDEGFYPAVLIVSGDLDRTCNPMHARKMTARLQAANASTRPILLDYQQTRGHNPTQPFSERVDALTNRLAFICNELGVCIEESL